MIRVTHHTTPHLCRRDVDVKISHQYSAYINEQVTVQRGEGWTETSLFYAIGQQYNIVRPSGVKGSRTESQVDIQK